MIIASFTSMLRISVKDCDHRSQPDVWGNNDRKHMIKPLNIYFLNELHVYEYVIEVIVKYCDNTSKTELDTAGQKCVKQYIIRRYITSKLYIVHYIYVFEVIVKYCANTCTTELDRADQKCVKQRYID